MNVNFELVRLGWPNAAVVLALAAVPFMSVLLPAAKAPIAHQVEMIETEPHPIGVASVSAD